MNAYDEQKAVARANRAFYAAFEALDFDAMRALWSEDQDVRCVHPGWELITGRSCVLDSWEAIFENTEEIRFDLVDLEIAIRGDVAVVTGLEGITSTVEGSTFRSEAVCTNVYVRQDGAWKMTVHHASPILNRVERENSDDEGRGRGREDA